MTEKDLHQKVAARRLLWRMGYSTRIDVVLRAVELANSDRGGQRSPEAFTDLDVLGVAITPSGQVQTCIVDCKTGNRSVIGRMFWVRGLVELFGADTAIMVRDQAISADAQQLASRLDISAFTETDIAQLEASIQSPLPVNAGPLSGLFEAGQVEATMKRYIGMDRRLKSLLDFRQFQYWVHEDHLNLVALPDVLIDLKNVLDPSNPLHVGLVVDAAWLYLLTLARCVAALRSAPVSRMPYGLSEYIAGGTTQLNQKREIAELLRSMQSSGRIPERAVVEVNPRFFDPLLELVTRLTRRGAQLNAALRTLEYQAAASMLGGQPPARDAFGDAWDRTAAKLALDVVEFLVTSAGLSVTFSLIAREALVGSAGEGPFGFSQEETALVERPSVKSKSS